jgi:hypothetical protein
MPRIIITSSSKSPKHAKLIKRLAQELTSQGNDRQPLILEEQIDSTGSRHVHVVWDEWKGIPDEVRSRVIVEAYQQAEGDSVAEQITIAAGVTAEESLALGLLPWKVRAARKRHEAQPTMAEHKKAFAAEARNTLLGGDARELRYSRAEDAEDARQRLEKALPRSKWIVEKEVQYE